MLINTFLDTEDFVHLYYTEDEPPAAQGCGAGARMASKYPRPPSPDYSEVSASSSDMTDRERYRAPPQPEPPPHRVRAADLYPRLRTHYDEPGLEVGFSPICGEFVQWVGRTADGGSIAMSNYRLQAQPRRRTGPGVSVPLRLIDAVEISELLHLVVLCKHGRQIKCTFNTGEQCAEWWRRLTNALAPMGSVQDTFAAAYAAWAKEQPPASVHRALMRASHAPQKHWFGPEVERLGFTGKGAWRVTAANAEYKLCNSYPPLLVVPASIGDEDLDSVARFRALRRIPTVVWRHRGNGAVIARSSQPEVGWFGWRSSEDERLLAAFVSACNADRGLQPAATSAKQIQQLKLLIVDARSYASAVTNRARGGGCECQQYYPAADIQFMSLPNIHHVRKSFQQMRALSAEPSDQANWHSNLERTLWPQYVCGVIRAARLVAGAVLAGRPVLVHCSDGWDRTPQIVATAQLILDPHYRTLQGFRILIEREWLDFGHKFADRCGHQFGPEEPNERSPIFLQWLDVVHQMLQQYPCSFEFNDAYLVKLATHVHSCMFGTFLCNTGRERLDSHCAATAQVWTLLASSAYRNHLYPPHVTDQVLWPQYGVRHMRVWWRMFGGDEPDDDQAEPPPARPAPTHNGLMTKTRSCDNLLNEGEKRTAQRRCSDPSIAPDLMKLSVVGSPDRESRTALTDSCVDALPALPPPDYTEQVVNLHPDHFENANRIRDIASGSSSLERELNDVTPALIPHDDVTNVTHDVTSAVITHDVTSAVITHDVTSTVITHEQSDDDGKSGVDMTDSVIRIGVESDEVDTPEDPTVFVCDTYTDVIGMAEAARESGRTRNISITWRSISESSNQSNHSQSSTGFELPEPRADLVGSHESSPVDVHNHNSTEGDVVNHNVVQLTNHSSVVSNGVNGLEEVTTKFLEVDLNGGATSSSLSSESEGEGGRARGGSQLTLCPASPRRPHHRLAHATPATTCWCGLCGGGRGGLGCGVCGGGRGAAEPLDGLPLSPDRLQARLHHIILYQKKVVEELSSQLRAAREALRRATPPPGPAALPSPPPLAVNAASTPLGSSSSGSASEPEVGEEAAPWLPDSAAPRCQHCRHHFWLARRRHHCRRCGGIFCGSCTEMSSWGDCGSVRVCRRCRALR